MRAVWPLSPRVRGAALPTCSWSFTRVWPWRASWRALPGTSTVVSAMAPTARDSCELSSWGPRIPVRRSVPGGLGQCLSWSHASPTALCEGRVSGPELPGNTRPRARACEARMGARCRGVPETRGSVRGLPTGLPADCRGRWESFVEIAQLEFHHLP